MSVQDTVFLADYARFGFEIDHVELDFTLHPTATRVRSRIAFRPNGAATDKSFRLHGTDLKLIRAAIDGREISPDLDEKGLTCSVPDAPFTWEAEVEINPEANTTLEGLYISGGMFCTQCEAEGFRRITYYPDRPDVMAPFTVRIHSQMPVLLSNGDPIEQRAGFAHWHDPHPKPAYLFALVAGDLAAQEDRFTTRSGRDVALNLWVCPADLHKCDFALQSLKLSMDWDERIYGREYDLSVFNIVAVADFNGGAMENKGLNLFNSALVLASPETTTDASYERIESVIAHEYFHNWTGNRITCRDWFQLCLKEGLTVFRDQQFTADMRSEPVKRINDVLMLRAAQFAEDAGPLAHPVRPDSFVEINNFYTATVYEKGAEVIRALKTLVGDEVYGKALDLYFERHDGQACTIEDWLRVFEEVSERDLSQFKLWYTQAGTPQVSARAAQEGKRLTLTLRQEIPDTPGQSGKKPMVIPVVTGVLDENGAEIAPSTTLELTEMEQSFIFDLPGEARAVPSLLRGFSAPVALDKSALPNDDALLLAHDSDPFNRWEAGRALAQATLLAMVAEGAAPDPAYLEGIGAVLADTRLDPAFLALMLGLPDESTLVRALATQGNIPDPMVIRAAMAELRQALAGALEPQLAALYDANQVPGPFDPSAGPAGKRALANACLGLLSLRDGAARAKEQFARADNMTLRLAALAALLKAGEAREELAAFETRWQDDPLVMDLWFSIQITNAVPQNAVETAHALARHPKFDGSNPNRLRALLGPLMRRPSLFHAPGGAAYAFAADWIIQTDARNPMLAARLCGLMQDWRLYDAPRQALIGQELNRIANAQGLSRDTGEMIARLGATSP